MHIKCVMSIPQKNVLDRIRMFMRLEKLCFSDVDSKWYESVINKCGLPFFSLAATSELVKHFSLLDL